MEQDDRYSDVAWIGKEGLEQCGISGEDIDVGVAKSCVKLQRQFESPGLFQGDAHAVIQEWFCRQSDALLPFDEGFELLERLTRR